VRPGCATAGPGRGGPGAAPQSQQAGAAANGLLQAPYTLAVTIKTIVLASIGSVSLATIAPQTDPRETSRAIHRILNVVLPLGASALGLIGLMGLMGVPAMAVLYSRAFTTGAVLFPYLLTADLLQVFVWVVGTPLLARGDRMLWLILDLVQYGARWALAMILMRSLGAYAVVVGYLASVALHVALNLVIYHFRYRLELPMRHIRRLVVGLALVAVVAAVGARPTASIPATAAVALAWIAYTAHHARQSGMLAHLWQRFVRR
jgi:O-antigen/teichoic acid export membrane protein